MIWCRTPFLYGTVVSIVALLSRPVVAGNLDTFYLGNDAAMLGGAVTATATSGSASWYNPAGVGASGYSNIEVNASAYLLRFGGTSDLEGTPGVPASKRKLSSLDVNAVPTALSVKRRILGLDVALGVFVPIRTVSYPRTSIQVRPANRPPEALTLDGNLRTTDYYAGFSVGRALQPNLRLGGSLFGYYSSVVNSVSTGANRGLNASTSDFSVTSSTFDQQRLGLQVVWGLQWDPSKHWHVGVVFRSPVFRLYEQTQAVTLSGSSSPNASPPTSNYSLGFQGNLGIEAKQLTPMRVHAGIAHDLSKGVVAFEGSLQAPYNGSSSKSPSIAVANIRAGLRGPITTTTWLGGGIFTDRTSVRRLAATGDTAIDYYGVSLGLEFGTPYRVLDDPPTGAPVRRLLMSTTLALSYALGVGDVANIGFTASNGGNQLFETTPLRQNVIAHEFVLHIGSTLAN